MVTDVRGVSLRTPTSWFVAKRSLNLWDFAGRSPFGATWRLRHIKVPVSGRLRVNSPEAVRDAVAAGLGIGHGPQWLFEAGLKDGSSQLPLGGYATPPVPIQILYVANRLLPKRAIVFMDLIAQAFSMIPALT